MPDNAQALNNLGAAHFLLGDFGEAASAWERSLDVEPTALAYSNTGSALYFLGEYRKAVDMYQKAVEYAPEDFQNWGSLGDAYRYTKDELQELSAPMYEHALKLAQARIEINPSDAITLSLVAYYEAALGRREDALQHMAQATALAPRDMYVYYNNALMLSTLGDLEQAGESLNRAVELGYSMDLAKLDAGFGKLFEAGYPGSEDATRD